MKNADKITIIEPHYDDAWLNVGGLILQLEKTRFKIISVVKDNKNYRNETESLMNYLTNVECVALKFQGVNLPEKVNPIEVEIEKFYKLNKLQNTDPVIKKIEAECFGTDIVFLPVGLFHPMHLLVSTFKLKHPNILYYLEFPYFYPQKIKSYRRIELSRTLRIKIHHFFTILQAVEDKKLIRIRLSKHILENKIKFFDYVYHSQKIISRKLHQANFREEIFFKVSNDLNRFQKRLNFIRNIIFLFFMEFKPKYLIDWQHFSWRLINRFKKHKILFF